MPYKDKLEGADLKTYLSVEVTHEKPLPEKIAETLTYRIGERVHGYLYAQGQECAVVVRKDKIVYENPTPSHD